MSREEEIAAADRVRDAAYADALATYQSKLRDGNMVGNFEAQQEYNAARKEADRKHFEASKAAWANRWVKE